MAFKNGTDKTKGWSNSHCQMTQLTLITVYFQSKCTGITKLFPLIFVFWKIGTRTVVRIFCVVKRNYGEGSETGISLGKQMKATDPTAGSRVSQDLASTSWESFPARHTSGRAQGLASPELSTSAITLGTAAPFWCRSLLGIALSPPCYWSPQGLKAAGLTVKTPPALFHSFDLSKNISGTQFPCLNSG